MPTKLPSLRLTEIFYSLQGETHTAGLPTLFIRLTGCPLRCGYCDTEYAFHGGKQYNFDDIFAEVERYQPQNICVTGGEPLAQPLCIDLLHALVEKGYNVSLETSGAMPIENVDARVSVVMDLKTPGSGEVSKNLYGNIAHLKNNDQIKFVITSREDYQWAKMQIDQYKISDKVSEILVSPSFGQLNAKDLANWVVADNLPVRFQLQLHKILWNDEPGH